MAIDKSTWNKNVKVSQSTIDDIKKLGMTKALKLAKQNAGATQGGLVKEYQEATRRLYGDKRFAAATKAATPMKKGSYQAGSAKSSKATYTTGSGVKYKASGTPAAKPAAKPTTTKATTKKDNTANIVKGVAGTAAAIGLLVAGRGKGASTIAKLSPQVGRAMNSTAGRWLTGTVEKSATKAASTSGRIAAKAGKPVSQTQYDAMVSAAKAKGISTTAKKATTTAAKKTAAKKTAAAPKMSRWDANAPKAKAPKPPKK